MTWEISSVIGVFFVPIMTTYMANKTLKTSGSPELFYWLRMLMFLFNMFCIGLGLWVAREIASLNNTNVTTLLDILWQGYFWTMLFVILVIVVVVVFSTIKELWENIQANK